jgi:vitamin B12 transporter
MKSLSLRAPRLASVPLVCISLAAQAQSSGQPDPLLAETVVTANRSEQLLSEALPHTTVIGRDVIERSQAPDLPTLLSSEAGFQFTQNGGRGTAASLFLRGSASLQVLVLIDGVPITKQDTTGAVSLEHIMLDQVERVEVVRGNVSAIYGSGAIGGVIQVFTRRGKGEPLVQAQLELGGLRSSRASVGVLGQAGSTRYSLGLSRQGSGGFTAMDSSKYPNENPDADGYRNTSYSVSLSHEPVRGHEIGLRAMGSDGRFDFDGGGYGSLTDVYKGVNTLNTWSLFGHHQISRDWRSELTYSQGRERSVYDASQTSSPYDSAAITQTRTLNWTNAVALGNWLFTVGAERQLQGLDATDNYGLDLQRQRSVTAWFGGVSANLGDHALQLNLRHDKAEGLDAASTAYLGYGYQLSPAWKLVASASTAFNLPPLGYLYDPSSGNPALMPELANSREVGVQWAQGPQIVRATWFDTRTRNQLLYSFTSFTFDNVSRSTNQGLEVSYSGPVAGTDVRASLTLQDPRDESTGLAQVRRARTMAALGVSRPLGAWTLGAELRYTGERPDTSVNPSLDAYTLAQVSARYRLAKDTTLTARIDNLFDAKYQTAYGYNQPPRTAFVGVVWNSR